MTAATARTTANVVVATVGVAAAYVVLTTPSLRRLARGGLRLWLGTTVPEYMLYEVGRAWMQSAAVVVDQSG